MKKIHQSINSDFLKSRIMDVFFSFYIFQMPIIRIQYFYNQKRKTHVFRYGFKESLNLWSCDMKVNWKLKKNTQTQHTFKWLELKNIISSHKCSILFFCRHQVFQFKQIQLGLRQRKENFKMAIAIFPNSHMLELCGEKIVFLNLWK